MLIPKKNRKLIYEHLFKEGVLVAKKDFNAPKHDEVDVPNLQVIKAMQVCVCPYLSLYIKISFVGFV
jgi:small subunit ribosomal protein S10e